MTLDRSIELSPQTQNHSRELTALQKHCRTQHEPGPARDLDSKQDSAALRAAEETPMRSPGSKLKRKTKRLVWSDDLHMRFVSAVFELGVKNASPKPLLELMETKSPTEGLTMEHIKSHLQKNRINYERSRLEVQRQNEKHTKRHLKRHHRHSQHQGAGGDTKAPGESIAGTSDQWTSSGVTLPQDTNQQWNMCDAILLQDEASEHMHWTMQQRMDFHRELLRTRSVEVGSGLSWANMMTNLDNTRMDSKGAASGNYNEQGSSSFLQAWTNAEQLRQPEEQVYGRLYEQQQSLFQQMQDVVPVAPFRVSPPRPTGEGVDTDGGVDLTSWGRLSLTVDPDDDDVFGFLGGS